MSLNEVWKPIKNYEGLYEVSNFGRVKSMPRLKINHGGKQLTKEKILKGNDFNKGYLKVPLTDNNHVRKYFLIHRLVAEAFIINDNPKEKTDVNHIDGNKKNNCVNNLEWCTRSYNLHHAYENGLRPTVKELCIEIENLRNEVNEIKKQINKV